MGKYLDLWDVSEGHPVAREELETLRIIETRYEKVRKMTPREFQQIYDLNLCAEKPFDQLVDEWE